ncbi:MAG: DUF2797 domain-containing protein [Gammaproteobacteria bacterium]|nr:DUF2797 domain-containing protein [Gammaproteobacteria bacterium]
MLEGVLQPLTVQTAAPAAYRLTLTDAGAESGLDLNPLLGQGLCIESLRRRISCCHCGSDTRRSYGGYCYPCFTTLARCDLCVVSPARCHYAQGTCREPAWGESFCMQPHVVYLANSSGPKVGLTRSGREMTRWLDQGASQGLLIATTPDRHRAGVVEALLAQQMSDRTDWRRLLRGPPASVDLPRLRDAVRPAAAALPEGVRWLEDRRAVTLDYPIVGYPRQLSRFRLDRHAVVAGRLIGIKGQYLLFEHGVFPVREHRGWHVRVAVADEVDQQPADLSSAAGAIESARRGEGRIQRTICLKNYPRRLS